MFQRIRNTTYSIASRENLILLAVLVMGIFCVILPIAEADLKDISGGYGCIDSSLIRSPEELITYLEAYGSSGRSLFKFIMLTAGLVGSCSLFLLSWLLAFQLEKESYLKPSLLTRLLPPVYLLFALVEKALILFLMEWYPSPPLFLGKLTVVSSFLKWTILFLIIMGICVVVFKHLHRGHKAQIL